MGWQLIAPHPKTEQPICWTTGTFEECVEDLFYLKAQGKSPLALEWVVEDPTVMTPEAVEQAMATPEREPRDLPPGPVARIAPQDSSGS